MRLRRHPDWLKVRIGSGESYSKVKQLLRNAKLHTICEEAKCPNIAECFGNGTAVFLILGNICTRNCKYCNVIHGIPGSLNTHEPKDIAESVKTLRLKYVVITSVTRDDLKNGGANVFFETVQAIRQLNECKIEVLIPDFKGNKTAIVTVIDAAPDVINHNIEVVEDLFPLIRPQGDYHRSLNVLKLIKTRKNNIPTKSGFMVGLGETKQQIYATMLDLKEKAFVDFLTIGQYLQPTQNHVEIKKYYTPKEFLELKTAALKIGFSHVESGPLVRSSYHAKNVFL